MTAGRREGHIELTPRVTKNGTINIRAQKRRNILFFSSIKAKQKSVYNGSEGRIRFSSKFVNVFIKSYTIQFVLRFTDFIRRIKNYDNGI